MTMGTASTMAAWSRRSASRCPTTPPIRRSMRAAMRCRRLTGRRIVEMVHEDLRLSKILTPEAFQNAIRVNGAIGGSTNAVLHLIAIAGRSGAAWPR